MPVDAKTTPIPASLFARVGQATRYVISGVTPDGWFGPQQPMQPMAPAEVKGRQFDYPFGVNLNYNPRASEPISFADLRSLADALPLLRAVIETRKDQVAALDWTVRPLRGNGRGDAAPRSAKAANFLARPDRRHSFDAWLRMLLEDMLVIDASCVYPRFASGGALYSLDVIDGSTITPLLGLDGRAPEAPDPAYQQVLHGVPAADFSADELLYRPRNVRSHRVYGFSPVEQIALTINIALRRDAATLEYYNSGSVPDAFATLPKEWTPDQIRSFQDYFDALLSGNLGRRRMLKFVPSEFKLIEARQPPLKDQYDEWLARLICYAFSVPASAFVTQVNRATSATLRLQATQEGLVPLKAWIKDLLDTVVQEHLGESDLEFAWVGDDAVDPLQQAQTLNILVTAGIKTREEARAELGLEGPPPKVEGSTPKRDAQPAPIDKSTGGGNPYHDDAGQFTTAENAVAPGGRKKPQSPPKPKGELVASTNAATNGALSIGSGQTSTSNSDSKSPSDIQIAGDPREDDAIGIPPGRYLTNPSENGEVGAAARVAMRILQTEALVNDGLTVQEAKIALQAHDLIVSPEFAQIEAAYKAGTTTEITLGNYTVVYQPDIAPGISGMTLFNENGFVIGPQAFSSRLEASKTVLQELYRLNTSNLRGSAAADGAVGAETDAARDFADRAAKAMSSAF